MAIKKSQELFSKLLIITRGISVGRRIFGGFLILASLLVLTIPFVIRDHLLLVERLEQVTNVDKRTDRLLLLSSRYIESSRVNLMRFLRNYLPNTQESVNDITQAAQFLAEAEKLIVVQEQKTTVGQIIETVSNYQKMIQEIGVEFSKGKDFETSRIVFTALRTGSDIGLRIENIVEKNEARIADESRIADTRFKKSLWFLLSYYAGTLILSLFLAALVGRSIKQPVSELRYGAESFRQGHTDSLLAVTGTDELSLLAATFNQMAEKLHHNKIALQERADSLEQELSERKRAEEELQRYQAKLEELVQNRTDELSKSMEVLEKERIMLRDMMDSSPVGVGILTEGKLRFANSTYLKMFDIEVGSPIINIFLDPSDQQAIFAKLKKEGVISNYEIKMRGAGGHVIDTLAAFLPTIYEGKPGILGWLLDVSPQKKIQNEMAGKVEEMNQARKAMLNIMVDLETARKETEARSLQTQELLKQTQRQAEELSLQQDQIRKAEERSRTILSAISVGTMIIHPKTKVIVDVNPVGAGIIGLSRDEIIGRTCHKFVCPKEEFQCPITDFGQTIDNSERVLLNAEGKEVPVIKTVTRVILGDEELLLESFVDITERKEIEKKLHEKMEELERFNKLTINREEKMILLKEEINALLIKMGSEPKYKIVE
jgi:PAS domain S-box-containing protein